MNDLLFRLLAVAAGVTLAIQPPINARLRATLGDPFWASFISFIIGAIALAVMALVLKAPFPNIPAAMRGAPWWVWTGGFCGVAYVTLALVIVPRIGSAALLSLAILGMLIGAMVVDHFGIFGVPVHRISLLRIAGAGLIITGAVCVARP